ncbi:MBL fold metallo-hydrolase [Falsibacillus pallidus]|uniref:Glyoxylase-like metal-dependent hydrolase (Beta-lactamase superfamily II) n=1 Tax=Falsibacillus pallidus TaxID=493781 RepID=A0A370GH48_9BACI|nr:MBL fold metallo-hydrolase [Falsibacillus pallidus]RDI41243.1 glyoxylase-like metal-dependent hydrolase (beta-lactamase superfamily II) [Falsibacillus pallidus]
MSFWQDGIAKLTVPTPFAVGDVNMYIVKGEKLTLIDAGPKTEEAWDGFKLQLSILGLTPDDIEQVVLTHHHPDHVGLLDFLPDDIDVYGHPYCEQWINRDEHFNSMHDEFYGELFRKFGIMGDMEKMLKVMKSPLKYSCHRPLTGVLREGGAIPGMAGWTVYETPGHAQSHLSFYHEGTGVLIAGDHILATISSNPLIEPPYTPGDERPRPQLQYNESLKKMLKLPISKVYTGHGTEVAKVGPLVERRLKKQHDRAMQVKGMIAEESKTVFEICKELFPAVYERELGLTISETAAQLDYLLSIGEAAVSEVEGVQYFSAIKPGGISS